MLFMEDDALRELEMQMQGVPNFTPRGHGMIVLCQCKPRADNCKRCPYDNRKKGKRCRAERSVCISERIRAGAASYREILTETMSSICYPPFVRRLEQYLKESEEHPMDFKNDKHRVVFTEAVRKLNKNDHALMAALYLLTADWKLWNVAEKHTERNRIHFEHFRLRGGSESSYALYCAAKDLYLGSKNLTIGELSDTRLIPPKIFALVCNAMAIRRFGLAAIKFHQERSG